MSMSFSTTWQIQFQIIRQFTKDIVLLNVIFLPETLNKPDRAPILSGDSDLEDSMLFVDPDDTTLSTVQENHDLDIEPEAKKPRLSGQDKDCRANIGKKDYRKDCNPDFLAFLTSDEDYSNETPGFTNDKDIRQCRTRFFSGNQTPWLSRQKATLQLHDCHYQHKERVSRTRSFSEAGHYESLETQKIHGFMTKSSLLLEYPDESLSNNPFFEDLKSTLLSDLSQQECPQTLFETLSVGPKQDVYARERTLQSKFSSLQSKYPHEISELVSFYQQQSAEVEMERLKEIHDENLPRLYRNHLNQFYDNQLHTIMERVEKSLGLLSSTKREIINIAKTFKTRPLLSRRAVAMMEEWYQRNFEHPYPSPTTVEALAKAGEITPEQVKKWFANKRNRSKNNEPSTEVANMKRKRQFSARW